MIQFPFSRVSEEAAFPPGHYSGMADADVEVSFLRRMLGIQVDAMARQRIEIENYCTEISKARRNQQGAEEEIIRMKERIHQVPQSWIRRLFWRPKP